MAETELMTILLKSPGIPWERNSNWIWGGIEAAQRWDHPMGLHVMISLSTVSGLRLGDGTKWWHLSISCRGRLPSWADLLKVRNDFLGVDRETYQVLPAKADYVNIAECLHLWAPCDGIRRVANLQDLVLEELP
jgi:hypothetical protein